jgi:hypothetical protein
MNISLMSVWQSAQSLLSTHPGAFVDAGVNSAPTDSDNATTTQTISEPLDLLHPITTSCVKRNRSHVVRYFIFNPST